MNTTIQRISNADEVALGGFTHLINFKASSGDLTETSTATAQTLSFTLPYPAIITDAFVKVVTELSDASDSGHDDVQLTVKKIAGAAGALTTFITTKQVGTSATVAAYAGANTTRGAVTGSDETLDLVFLPKTGKSLVNLDGGEVNIYIKVIDLSGTGT